MLLSTPLRALAAALLAAAAAQGHREDLVASRVAAALPAPPQPQQQPHGALRASVAARLVGLLPPNVLSHFCIVCSWTAFNQTLQSYATFLGEAVPDGNQIAGGPDSNGTYLGHKLIGTTKIAFMRLNNETQMEFLAGEPSQPSWWRDVYLLKGVEVHHMGYVLPARLDVWAVTQSLTAAGLGPAVQWGHWGTYGQSGSGCYVYVDTQASLGVTVELLGGEANCANLPVVA